MKVLHVEDYNLVQKCREGDTEAYDTLVDRLTDKITANVSFRVPLQDAPDVIQDIFAAIVLCIHNNQYLGRSKLETYVYRITVNKVADYYRKRGKRAYSESVVLPGKATNPWEAVDDTILLQQLSSKLSDDYQEVLELKLAGSDFGEISNKLGFSYEAGRSRYRRCAAQIRKKARIYRIVERMRRY